MPRLFILCDSTGAVKTPLTRPETGWGETFGQYLKDGWILDNRSVNGRSTKDSIRLGEFQRVLDDSASGDAAIIQFGHNDEKLDDPRGAEAWSAFRVNLIYMAEKLKAKGVHVIFATPIARRKFEDGLLVDSHGDWPAAMKAAAHEACVPCVDMTMLTMVEIMKKGEDESKDYFMHFGPGLYENYPEGDEDDTHLRPEGAEWISSLLYKALSSLPDKPEFIK